MKIIVSSISFYNFLNDTAVDKCDTLELDAKKKFIMSSSPLASHLIYIATVKGTGAIGFKGTVNRVTILETMLFLRDIDEQAIILSFYFNKLDKLQIKMENITKTITDR